MYGLPIAIISAMQPAIIEAVKNVMPGIPHQFCQYHFIKILSFLERKATTSKKYAPLIKQIKNRAIEIAQNLPDFEQLIAKCRVQM